MFGGLGIGFRETIVDSEAQVVVGKIVAHKSQVLAHVATVCVCGQGINHVWKAREKGWWLPTL